MNILFVTSNRIGDAVLSTGLLRHLIETYPEARITLACGPAAAPLFAATPNVVQVITMTKGGWARHWLDLWRRTAIRAWDLVIDLRASLLVWLLIAKRRHVLRTSGDTVHRLRLLADVLQLGEPPLPKIWIADDHRAAAERLIPDGEPVLGLGPTANWGGKQWPGPSFAELARRLTAPAAPLDGAQVAVFGAPTERAAAAEAIAGIPEGRAIDLVGQLDLLTAFACLERCALFVGNDSGLMHLAAASGVPTLGLFGPSREVQYGPWGENSAVVRTPQSYEDLTGAPHYDYRNQESLMTGLSVDAVQAAASELWRRCGGLRS